MKLRFFILKTGIFIDNFFIKFNAKIKIFEKHFTMNLPNYFGGKNKILVFYILLAQHCAWAQINNDSLLDTKPDTSLSNNWRVEFNSLSYFQNREYFEKMADGYTLFGNQFSPKVIYKPAKNVNIEAGIFLKKDFGNSEIKAIQPIFTVVILKDSSQFRFGNLNANLNHQLIEPLYNFEGVLNNNLETGLQLISKKNGSFLDIWLDWQKMIYRESNFKEEIWGGMHYKPMLYAKDNFVITSPIQFTAYHKGGQITIDKSPLKTEINLALGLNASWKNVGKFQKISLQNYILGFKEQSNFENKHKSGTGFYLNAGFEGQKLNGMLSYFYGNSYNSFSGGDIYQSINKNNITNTEKYRKLLIMRLYKDFKIISNLFLIARFEPFYNFNTNKLEHSEGLFISYKEIFSLKKN